MNDKLKTEIVNFDITLRTRYSLEELLAQCDETADFSAEDQIWIDSLPVGRELF